MAIRTFPELQSAYENAPSGARLAPVIVAAGLNLSSATLERWRSVGRGPKFVKINGAIRYRKSDVEDFVARCGAEV